MLRASEVPTNGMVGTLKTGCDDTEFSNCIAAKPREEGHGVSFLLAKEAKKLPSHTGL
jgi:hypothetical protein